MNTTHSTLLRLSPFGAAALVLVTSASLADPPPAAVLTVRVSQLRSNDGLVGCSLYSSPRGFPTDSSAALQRRWCAIKDKASTCAFDPVPAGSPATLDLRMGY